MALFIPTYSASVPVFTTSALASLSSGGVRKSVPIDNSMIKAADVRLMLDLRLGTTIAAGNSIDVYLAASHDGITMTDGYSATALDTTSIAIPTHSQLIVSIPAISGSAYIRWEDSLLTYITSLPKYFSIVVHNKTNSALNASHTQSATFIYTTFEYA